MGGKSSSPAAPAPAFPQQDNSEMIAMMNGMMGSMMETMANMPQAPNLPPTPEIAREPIINWAEKQEQLLAKTKADYNVDRAGKKNRTDTIITSPLLDDEDPDTTNKSLIAK